jgi:hypothetical protein
MSGVPIVFQISVAKLAFGLAAYLFYCLSIPDMANADNQDWMVFNAPKATTPATPRKPGDKQGQSRRSTGDGSFNLWGGGEDPADTVSKSPPPPSYVGRTVMPASFGRQQWKVHRVAWTAADEVAFGEFLRHIGESDCKTTHECLTSPVANPAFHARNPAGMQFFADCADLPFILRAYFAWMNGLPYSFSAALDVYQAAAPARGDRKSTTRRSEFASFVVTGRRQIVPPGPDAAIALNEISNIVSTNHFRHPAAYKGRFLPDYYPVKISKATVKPGVVIFDPLGHIAVVYKVSDDGEIHFIDAHPDNSLTRGTYGSEVERAGPESGAGIKAWRPQRLVNAQRSKTGALSGGEVVVGADNELPDWSDEQYYGVGKGRSADWKSGRFNFKGDDIDYYGYIRLTLARDGFRYNPIKEASTRVASICQEFGYRINAVEAARKANIDKQAQPGRLPTNIYMTQGYWETYATPSRDAKLKTMFVKLREEFERYIHLHENRSKLVDYSGTDIKGDLLRAYDEAASKCAITYHKSDGKPVTLGFEDLKARLFTMSFDPHHCVERRWGATTADELASCRDDASKRAWYDAQQRLRNQLVRTIGDRMDFTLDDLKRQARENSDVGENDPPDIDIAGLLTVAPAVATAHRAASPVVPETAALPLSTPVVPAGVAPADVPLISPALASPPAATEVAVGSDPADRTSRPETSAAPAADAANLQVAATPEPIAVSANGADQPVSPEPAAGPASPTVVEPPAAAPNAAGPARDR